MTAHPVPTKHRRFGAIAFDFDGTLVDSIDYIARGWEKIAELSGIELTTDVRRLVGMTGEQIADVVSEGNAKLRETLLQKRLEVFDVGTFVRNVKPFPEVVGVLIELRRSEYPMALSSSTAAFKLVELSDLYGIYGLFDVVIEDDEAPRSKPAPVLLIETAKRLSMEAKDIAYVGDTAYDVEATLAAGSIAILVLRGKNEYDGPQPHFVISDLRELLLLG